MSAKFKFYVAGVLKELLFDKILQRDDNFDIVDIAENVYVPKAPLSETDLTLPGSIWLKDIPEDAPNPAMYEVYYGDKLMFIVNQTTGNLIYGLGNISNVPVSKGGTGGATPAEARSGLNLGDVATYNVGTGVDQILKFAEANKLPALDGSLLTNLPTLPPGIILYFPSSTPPTGFLECDGSLLLRSTYSNLFDIFGEDFGPGDGSTTFRLPDLRGQFIRGWDNGRGLDPARVLGSDQTDLLKAHAHAQRINGLDWDTSNSQGSYNGSSLAIMTPRLAIDTATVGGTETRPMNVALMPCIKF